MGRLIEIDVLGNRKYFMQFTANVTAEMVFILMFRIDDQLIERRKRSDEKFIFVVFICSQLNDVFCPLVADALVIRMGARIRVCSKIGWRSSWCHCVRSGRTSRSRFNDIQRREPLFGAQRSMGTMFANRRYKREKIVVSGWLLNRQRQWKNGCRCELMMMIAACNGVL